MNEIIYQTHLQIEGCKFFIDYMVQTATAVDPLDTASKLARKEKSDMLKWENKLAIRAQKFFRILLGFPNDT